MIADKLKKSVLQAAIQGKLTEQLPTDGDAKDLLKQIRAEKAKLIADGKIKPDKKLPPITAEEIPFDIPTNWTWCRLGDICNYGTNSTVVAFVIDKYRQIRPNRFDVTNVCELCESKFLRNKNAATWYKGRTTCFISTATACRAKKNCRATGGNFSRS